MIPARYLGLLTLVVILPSILAAPPVLDVDKPDSSLVKRMENPDLEAGHDFSCLCLDCFAKRAGDLPPVLKFDEAKESITQPILKTILCPLTTPIDFMLNDCERDRWHRYFSRVSKKHEKWLKEMGVDPKTVTVRHEQGVLASTSQGASMQAPQPMSSMDKNNTVRRRPTGQQP